MQASGREDRGPLLELRMRGLLSFGPEAAGLALLPLNVLIGANGSGKSNFVEGLDLMRSAAHDLTAPLRRPGGGGVTRWIWQGAPEGEATLEAVVDNPNGTQPLRHRMVFAARRERFEVMDEAIENSEPHLGYSEPYYHYRRGRPVLTIQGRSEERPLERQSLAPDESILTQRNEPDLYPALAQMVRFYRSVAIYREWQFGRSSSLRAPLQADLPTGRLAEDFSNLWMVLNRLLAASKARRAILEHLRKLYDGLDDIRLDVRGGTVEAFLAEGDFAVPANRLSDGTLRYLCLLAILCDPEPPGVICIEEPELGLHPDLIPTVADLLVEASERTQLVVTTHSDILVDALTEQPECVVTVEKHRGQTVFERQDRDRLAPWLEKYRLGQLWTSGEIGGTRW